MKQYEDGLQYLRKYSLIISDKNGQAVEITGLKITFKIQKGEIERPNGAEIKVYNLAPTTIVGISKEFSRVILQAGYKDNCSVIFDGNICSIRSGREKGTDNWLEIIAADGDLAYNFATVNTTLCSGSTGADRVAACAAAFSEKGTTSGYMPSLSGGVLPRGKVMYGMARKYMRDIAQSAKCNWSIQDCKLQIVEQKSYLPGEAVILTSETGLVGLPEQTDDGIKVRSLLNPKCKVGGRVQLDNTSILHAKTPLNLSAKFPAQINQDGLYRILKLEFNGDSRGNDWYTDMLCIGIDDTTRLPLDMVQQ